MTERWSPAAGRAEIEAALALLGRQADEMLDLAEGALLLAALDRPRVGLDRYREHLADLAAQVGARPAQRVDEAVAALNAVIRGELGYDGDSLTYDDPQNANLMRVIDRRKGLPVALAILYLHAARASGWPAQALRFPGHVLVRLELAGERAILDPFNEGRLLEAAGLRALAKAVGGAGAELTPDYTEPLSNHEVLLRLQNNIKLRRLQNGQVEAGLATLESMLLLAPGEWRLWGEAAELHTRLDNLRAAQIALANVIELAADPQVRAAAERQLRSLKNRIN